MTETVRITDVAPRDGLQAETTPVPVRRKADLVRAIQRTGVAEVEVSSFVSPKWIPQLGDAPELFADLATDKPEGILYSALVPNERGFDSALTANRQARDARGVERLIDKVSVFTAASETFAQKNTNATIADTIERFRPIVPRAHEQGMRVRAYISCVVACPYEGDIPPTAVAAVAARLLELGVDEIDLGDTIGAGTPETIGAVVMEVIDALGGRSTNQFGEPTLTLHLHDTFGHAPECVRAAAEIGVRSFDASSGGLGGCPYASKPGERAPGNIAMSTLVRTLESMDLSTGIDHAMQAEADRIASELIL
ncbi:MAG: hydroxymethylglutaryl-CoA lyase [Phycisphaerales bacterium]|nr:hydroxymethylglutaryl-CoA lyase [Planctomycetota bacterium]MCH8507688.1 hydroxymethylglutaryl-CoA lyase [Phycisphaerales bacterium]